MATRNRDTSAGGTISFKSVGDKLDEIIESDLNTAVSTKFPIGIKTPLELNSGELFKMHYDLGDQITDNLRNLILTNKGERLGNPAFGSNLKRVQMDSPNKEDAELQMMAKIQAAVKTFMPFVVLSDFTTSQLPPSMLASGPTDGYPGGALLVRITFSAPGAFAGTRGLQLILPMSV